MDSEQDEIPLTFADVIPLIIKTFQSFAPSLAAIAIFFTGINIGTDICRYISQSRIPPSQVLVSLIIINNDYQFPIMVSALEVSPKFQGEVVLYSLPSKGCSIGDYKSLEIDHGKLSMVLVDQGDCNLYSKASNAKLYGFSGILVYNQSRINTVDRDNTLTELDINILTANSINSKRIFKQMANRSVCTAHVKSNLSNIMNFKSIIADLALNLLVIYLSAVMVLTGWLLIYMIGTVIQNRNFRFYQAIVNGCLALSDYNQAKYVPKLRAIPFPERILNLKDIKELKDFSGVFESDISSYHDSCCICLDEFQVDNNVRALPCRHLFHTSCIDPWLLDHNRLCPICQQDVLKSVRLRDQMNTSLRYDDESDDLIARGGNQIHGNSIKHFIARWIQRRLA